MDRWLCVSRPTWEPSDRQQPVGAVEAQQPAERLSAGACFWEREAPRPRPQQAPLMQSRAAPLAQPVWIARRQVLCPFQGDHSGCQTCGVWGHCSLPCRDTTRHPMKQRLNQTSKQAIVMARAMPRCRGGRAVNELGIDAVAGLRPKNLRIQAGKKRIHQKSGPERVVLSDAVKACARQLRHRLLGQHLAAGVPAALCPVQPCTLGGALPRRRARRPPLRRLLGRSGGPARAATVF